MGWKFDVFNRDVASLFFIISTLFKLIKGLGFTLGSFFIVCVRFVGVSGVFLFGFFWQP